MRLVSLLGFCCAIYGVTSLNVLLPTDSYWTSARRRMARHFTSSRFLARRRFVYAVGGHSRNQHRALYTHKARHDYATADIGHFSWALRGKCALETLCFWVNPFKCIRKLFISHFLYLFKFFMFLLDVSSSCSVALFQLPRKQNENYCKKCLLSAGKKLFIDGFPFRTLEKISHYVNK